MDKHQRTNDLPEVAAKKESAEDDVQLLRCFSVNELEGAHRVLHDLRPAHAEPGHHLPHGWIRRLRPVGVAGGDGPSRHRWAPHALLASNRGKAGPSGLGRCRATTAWSPGACAWARAARAARSRGAQRPARGPVVGAELRGVRPDPAAAARDRRLPDGARAGALLQGRRHAGPDPARAGRGPAAPWPGRPRRDSTRVAASSTHEPVAAHPAAPARARRSVGATAAPSVLPALGDAEPGVDAGDAGLVPPGPALRGARVPPVRCLSALDGPARRPGRARPRARSCGRTAILRAPPRCGWTGLLLPPARALHRSLQRLEPAALEAGRRRPRGSAPAARLRDPADRPVRLERGGGLRDGRPADRREPAS